MRLSQELAIGLQMINNWIEVIAERNSPSDEELVCIKIFHAQGQRVNQNSTLFELEGAKANFDVQSEGEGYFYATISENEKFLVGSTIGYITSEPINNILKFTSDLKQIRLQKDKVKTDSVRLTQPAKEFLQELPNNAKIQDQLKGHSGLITLEILKNLIISKEILDVSISAEELEYWRNFLSEHTQGRKCILIGGGRGSIQALDLIEKVGGLLPIGYVSDKKNNYIDPIGMRFLGDTSLENLRKVMINESVNEFVLTVGSSSNFRLRIYNDSRNLGIKLISLIHPKTIIGGNVTIGSGTLIFGGVHIGTQTKIGNACFISSNSSIEHHNVIGNGFCCGPNTNTSGGVVIGEGVSFGINVGVEPDLVIGNNSVISSGIVLTDNVADKSTIKKNFRKE
jgi:acetyltransferase-like isoleucine patch superfamily enzyme